MSEVRIYLFYTDSPNITLISVNEEKIVKRKWLIDICSEFVEKYILSVDDMATLVAETCELLVDSNQNSYVGIQTVIKRMFTIQEE